MIVLATAAPIVATFAIQFGQIDYFLLAMLGLLLIGSLSSGSLAKGVFAAGAGIIIGLVGMDSMGSGARFTFGSLQLMNGIDFVVAILGLFGMSEILYQLKTVDKTGTKATLKKMAFPPLRFLLSFLPLSMRVSVMGVLIGALPGAGGEIAALLAYDHAKKRLKSLTVLSEKVPTPELLPRKPETTLLSAVP